MVLYLGLMVLYLDLMELYLGLVILDLGSIVAGSLVVDVTIVLFLFALSCELEH